MENFENSILTSYNNALLEPKDPSAKALRPPKYTHWLRVWPVLLTRSCVGKLRLQITTWLMKFTKYKLELAADEFNRNQKHASNMAKEK